MAGQVDEIKARIDIVDLISEYIRLKQTGTNWRALCPFHNEKSPSFMVSKDKQIFHCFGCNEGGDIFSFVQKMEGIEFAEALKILAQKAGVQLQTQDPKLNSQKNRLSDICKAAMDFWYSQLNSLVGGKAKNYLLNQRSITQKTIDEFKFGYAVDSWDTLILHLKNKGFKDQEIFLAGFSVKKDRGDGFYDRFRDRVMFPINDLHGSPIGFTGRTLKEDEKGGKYINTPQTLIYNKSLVWFNLDKAKQFIKKDDYAVVVEGQMDAISAWQVGTKNVIATSGTALTIDQVTILKRYTNNIAIAFDTDLAGQNAAKRGIDIVLQQEMNAKVIVLPGGKDPDDCIKNNPQDWKKAIEQAKSIMDYYFDETFSKNDLSTATGKKNTAKVLLPIISKIGDRVEQTHWLQKLADRLNVSEAILRESISPGGVKKSSRPDAEKKSGVGEGRDLMLYQRALAIGLKYPEHLPNLIDNLDKELISDKSLQSLYKNLILYYTETIKQDISNFDYQEFRSKIEDSNLEDLADKLVLLAEKDFFDFDSSAIKSELIKVTNFIKKHYYSLRLKEIEQGLRQAEATGDKDLINNFSEQYNQVITQLNFLE